MANINKCVRLMLNQRHIILKFSIHIISGVIFPSFSGYFLHDRNVNFYLYTK